MNGILYIATNSMKYVELAAKSAASVKQFIPNCTTKLYSDLDVDGGFDQVEKIENLTPGGLATPEWCEGKLYFENKIAILRDSPFERSLYLDCDITAVRPIDIFDLLDSFDLAVAHAPRRLNKWSQKLPVPECYPDFNIGLLLFKKNNKFFDRWLANYLKYPHPHDQTSFRLTAWESNVRIATLPPEYNMRPPKFNYGHEPAMLHG